MLAFLLVIACAKQSPPVPAGAEALPAPSEEATQAPPPEAAAQGGWSGSAESIAPPPEAGEGALESGDLKETANAWKSHHNDALNDLEHNRTADAVEAAVEAVHLAPTHGQRDANIVLAMCAEAAGETELEFQALDRLLDEANVPWGVFWNGALDAMSEDEPQRAHLYSYRAIQEADVPEDIAHVAVRAALSVGELDAAVELSELLDNEDFPDLLGEVARSLRVAGRCQEALRIKPTMVCG